MDNDNGANNVVSIRKSKDALETHQRNQNFHCQEFRKYLAPTDANSTEADQEKPEQEDKWEFGQREDNNYSSKAGVEQPMNAQDEDTFNGKEAKDTPLLEEGSKRKGHTNVKSKMKNVCVAMAFLFFGSIAVVYLIERNKHPPSNQLNSADSASILEFNNFFIDFNSFPEGNRGSIPWLYDEATNFTTIDNGTTIRVRKAGHYVISGNFNFYNHDKDTKSVTIYIIGTNKLFPERILPGSRRSIHFSADLRLKKEDILRIEVDGLKDIYQNKKANHFTIRRFA